MPKIVKRAASSKNRDRVQPSVGSKPGDPALRAGYLYVDPDPQGTRAERRLAQRRGITTGRPAGDCGSGDPS